jgi:DNA-binding MarR family transcriptional regulator
MPKIAVDTYVLETLMRDLIAHDKKPSAFIVYLHLWNKTQGATRTIKASHLKIADATGLSKSSIQAAIKRLTGRKLVRSQRASSTAVPEYTVLKPWVRGASSQ